MGNYTKVLKNHSSLKMLKFSSGTSDGFLSPSGLSGMLYHRPLSSWFSVIVFMWSRDSGLASVLDFELPPVHTGPVDDLHSLHLVVMNCPSCLCPKGVLYGKLSITDVCGC
jgi:hypothetical protein